MPSQEQIDLEEAQLLKERETYLQLIEKLHQQEAGLTDEDLRTRENCENSLSTFIQYMWRSIDPAVYKHNWHIDALSEHLEALVWGDIKHLLINISPRCMKSILGSVSFLPWIWAQQEKTFRSGPETSLLYSSYGQKLSLEHSLKARTLLNSPLYQRFWGSRFILSEDQNTVTKFTNNRGGYRMSTSVGSNLTGSGASIIGVDDPHNTVEMESEIAIQSVIDWWDTALSTRLNDPVEGRFFVIMQRLRENDLSGHILDQDQGEWTHLCYDKDTEVLTKEGWKLFKDINLENMLLGVDPKTMVAKWENPTKIINKFYEGDLINFKSQVFDMSVTPDHRVVYFDGHDMSGKEWPAGRVRAAKDLPGDFYIPQAVKWHGNKEEKIFFAGREWDVLNLCDFFGWYLSEGCANGKYRTTRIVQKNTSKYVSDIDDMMGKIPFHVSRYMNSDTMICWQIKDKALSIELGKIGKSLEKYVPDFIKEMSPENLQQMLLSYAKGDGCKSGRNRNGIEIASGSEKMIDDLQECAIKAGWAATKKISKCPLFTFGKKYAPKNIWKLYIRVGKKNNKQKKFYSKIRPINTHIEKYSDFVYCVSVPSTAVVVRRNGKVAISGNCLPMEFDSDRHCTTSIGFSDPRTEEGELMWPERIDEKALKALKKKLGEFGSSGQLQQAPVPKGGGIIKSNLWIPYLPGPDGFYPPMEHIVCVADTAYTEEQENDYSACVVMGIYRDQNDLPKIMIMHAWQERLALNALVLKLAATAKRFKVDRVLIENKASGISVEQEIRRLFSNEVFGVTLSNPKGDKVSRMYSVEPIFAEKIVTVPYIQDAQGNIYPRDWVEMVIKNVSQFPKGAHDDTADCISAGIKYLRDFGLVFRREEREADLERQMTHKGQKKPLYDI